MLSLVLVVVGSPDLCVYGNGMAGMYEKGIQVDCLLDNHILHARKSIWRAIASTSSGPSFSNSWTDEPDFLEICAMCSSHLKSIPFVQLLLSLRDCATVAPQVIL